MHLFPKPDAFPLIDHSRPVVLMGSCFSEHISGLLKRSGFGVNSNPAGVVFHPVPIARFLIETLGQTQSERVLNRDDIWLSWDASSAVYTFSEITLKQRLESIRSVLLNDLKRASVLIITLGSAHGYHHLELNTIVANCHKSPKSTFDKVLSSVESMEEEWGRVLDILKNNFPDLRIVVTISPVRYTRDGWIENNRSKARLLELAGRLEERFGVFYFPAYELVNDVLRDYRYFEADGVHPNAQAVEKVWDLFKSWFFNSETNTLVRQMEGLRRMEEHKPLFPGAKQTELFIQQFHEKRESFLSLHPFIIW